jgi:phage-related protein
MTGGPWIVDDYRTPGGGRPVKNFLDDLSKTARPKVYAMLDRLEAHGNRLGLPHSRPMGGGLHELRIGHPQGPFRFLYCFRPGRRIILLHGFVKRTEQTPRGDLDVARARQQALAREE